MKPKIFLETSVISYLTSQPSRDVLKAAHRQVTRAWWSHRGRFQLFVSQAVLAEIGRGDANAAQQRMEAVQDVEVLAVTKPASDFAESLLRQFALPENAAIDALHVAVAVVHGMDYLLTWNCTHIANAAIRVKIETACRDAGFQPPVICTPEELMED